MSTRASIFLSKDGRLHVFDDVARLLDDKPKEAKAWVTLRWRTGAPRESKYADFEATIGLPRSEVAELGRELLRWAETGDLGGRR